MNVSLALQRILLSPLGLFVRYSCSKNDLNALNIIVGLVCKFVFFALLDADCYQPALL